MEPQFYTAVEFNNLRSKAQQYRLLAPNIFWTKTADALVVACNGAGPDRWDINKRKALTSALKLYETAFAIHDIEYHYGTDSRSNADKRLYKNMLKIWRKTFGSLRWFRPKAWVERFKIIPVVFSVVTAGEQAWEEAKENRTMKNVVLLMGAFIMLGTGCTMDEARREELKNKAHTAILEYVQKDGSEKIYEYIDKLVAEGKLGKANADKLKEAIPQGIDKLKEVMGEIEKEESK